MMAVCRKTIPFSLSASLLSRSGLCSVQTYSEPLHRKRQNSTISAATLTPPSIPSKSIPNATTTDQLPPLSRLPTASLLRNILLGYCFTSPRLLKSLMSVMKFVINSKSPILNPDKNPVLRGILRAVVYDHFCAGTTPAEVQQTVARIKRLGYTGVILGYAREILVPKDQGKPVDQEAITKATNEFVASWLAGNQATIAMVGKGDYVNLKFTGAGPETCQALLEGRDPPKQVADAMDVLCQQAKTQGSALWIDAEQQAYQATIDKWAIDLMRRHNTDGTALVYNTIQAYLKASRNMISDHLQAAKDGNWTLGIKLVRGAYIQSDERDKIWDTKAETDNSYNTISRDLLTKSFAGFEGDKSPNVYLFCAGHNTQSVRQNTALYRDLVMCGQKVNPVAFGQLQGMADDVSCELVQMRDIATNTEGLSEAEAKLQIEAAPRPYKCLAWGSVQECMTFLMRRAVENATAANRVTDGLGALRSELWRRTFKWT